jgi:hypothetical protein
MFLQRHWYDDRSRTDAANRSDRLKEELNMYDSFSGGGVFYGLTAVIFVGIVAISAVLYLV